MLKPFVVFDICPEWVSSGQLNDGLPCGQCESSDDDRPEQNDLNP